jgi:hypothetical protein
MTIAVCLFSVPAVAQITYEVQVDYPLPNSTVNDIDLPVRGVVKRVGIGPNKPGAGFMEVTAEVDGVVKTTYTNKDGNFEFRFEPDTGTYSVNVSACSGLYTTTVTGVLMQRLQVGGVFDPRELYFDIARQNMIKSHINLHPNQLKWTQAWVTIKDETFDYDHEGTSNRQFPLPGPDTFPWTANNPNDYSAATNNHAGNPINPLFFDRLRAFCQNMNNSGIKVILTVFDPWFFKLENPPATVIANDPWAKYAASIGREYDIMWRIYPDTVGWNEPVVTKMKEYLDHLAAALYSLGPDVYLEFNNEWQKGRTPLTPSNDWMKEWQDYLYKQLRDVAGEQHSEVSVHMMINAQQGVSAGTESGDYIGDCWCHHDSVDYLGIGIRNFYLSGHCFSNWSSLEFDLCEYTSPPGGGECGATNIRGKFFTEGNGDAGGDEVEAALSGGYNVALEINYMYRDLYPFYGDGSATLLEILANNQGIADAVEDAWSN